MKIVYIAGPYAGPTHDHRSYFEIERHIANAAEAAAELVRLGYGFFCPHTHSAHFEVITPDAPPDFWRELDLTFLPICDALLLLKGWETSSGAKAERAEAARLGIPICTSLASLRRRVPPT